MDMVKIFCTMNYFLYFCNLYITIKLLVTSYKLPVIG